LALAIVETRGRGMVNVVRETLVRLPRSSTYSLPRPVLR
jgi:hypothetical protein